MTWSGAVTQYKTNLSTAAAALNPVIAIVRKGEPDSLNADTIAFWPHGWTNDRDGGDTFGKKSIERGLRTVIYLRASARAGAIDEALEDRLVAVEEAIVAALLADRDLGTNSIGLFIDSVEYGWQDFAGQWARTASFTAWVWLPEVFPI